MRDGICSSSGQEQGVPERGLGGEERRIERGRGLQMRDGFLGLIEIEETGAAQKLQVARVGFVLNKLAQESARAREIATAEERPCQARLRLGVIRGQLQRLAPFGGRLPIEAVGII